VYATPLLMSPNLYFFTADLEVCQRPFWIFFGGLEFVGAIPLLIQYLSPICDI
jgi:hypothetical protein